MLWRIPCCPPPEQSSVKSEPTRPSTIMRPSARQFGLILFGILAVAALLVFSTLGDEDLWLDEMHSLLNSAGHRAEFEALPAGQILHDVPRHTDLSEDSSVAKVWHDVRSDSHPPLFFVILHGWRMLCGDGDLVVRLPAALFSILAILPVALILREYDKRWTALVAASVLAIAYAHIQMGQQARPYSLVLSLVGVGFWLLVVMERRWTKFDHKQRVLWLSAYAVTTCLALLTHYFAGLALLGQAVFAALRFSRTQRYWLGGCVVLAMAVSMIVWLPGFLAQSNFIAQQNWVRDSSENPIWHAVARAADLPVRLLFHHPRQDWTARRVWLQVLPGLVIVVGAVVVVWRCRCREATVFLVWYFVPIAALASVDLLTGRQLLAHLRYPSVATPGLVGLIVIAAARLRRPLPVVLAALFAVVVASTLTLPATRNPQARQTATMLHVLVEADDLLVFDAIDRLPFEAKRLLVLVWHYLKPPYPDVLILEEPPTLATREAVRAYDRVFVVSPRIEAIENHTFKTHVPVDYWGHIRGIGWVCLFTRSSESQTEAGVD